MHGLLAVVAGAIISGLIWRLLASIGFGLATAFFMNSLISKYLNHSMQYMNTALHPDVAAYMNIARVDDCLSVIIGTISFIASYKSLKLIFVRKL